MKDPGGDKGKRRTDRPDPEALARQRILGARLKTMFDHVVDEPVPDEMLDLIKRLDKGGP